MMHRIAPVFAQMDEELALWREIWWLDGYAVTCKGCGVEQDIEDAQQAFPHKEDCRSWDGNEQYPWQVLRQVGVRTRKQGR